MNKILFIIKNKNEASSRFRVIAYLQHLKNDFDIDIFYAEYHNNNIPKILRSIIKRIRYLSLLRDANKYDVIYMQRPLSTDSSKNNFFEKLIVKINPNLIFDFDDALFIQNKSKISNLISIAKICICGNDYLYDFSKDYNPNTHVIPTAVDTKKFIPKENTDVTDITIGWTGTSGNYQFFTDEMINEISTILQTNSHVNFLFICDHKPEQRFAFPYDFIYWNEKTEVEDLQNIDIGLMPLIDSPWSKGKCGFKLIQYGAIGIASIASDVGVNSDIVLNNKSGILITDNTWEAALTTLINNAPLRESMGIKARQHIEKNYSLPGNYQKLRSIIHSLIKE
jgi:glycosyltransferase involved in cell wall biosynthesis